MRERAEKAERERDFYKEANEKLMNDLNTVSEEYTRKQRQLARLMQLYNIQKTEHESVLK